MSPRAQLVRIGVRIIASAHLCACRRCVLPIGRCTVPIGITADADPSSNTVPKIPLLVTGMTKHSTGPNLTPHRTVAGVIISGRSCAQYEPTSSYAAVGRQIGPVAVRQPPLSSSLQYMVNSFACERTQWRLTHLPDLIDKLRALVSAQYKEALLGVGDLNLRPAYSKFRLKIGVGKTMSDRLQG